MEEVWIIGAGKFGLRAAKKLLTQTGRYGVILVDQDRTALDQARSLGCSIQHQDGVEFINASLYPGKEPDWIVPALPLHLAWEWIRFRIGEDQINRALLPDGLVSGLPNPFQGENGDIYVSHADFLCPPNCSEPDHKCTHTGLARKEDMFRLLAGADHPGFMPFVIPSFQLGPGVGGYNPRMLFNLLEAVEGYRGNCFLATACRCHGVVTGARVNLD